MGYSSVLHILTKMYFRICLDVTSTPTFRALTCDPNVTTSKGSDPKMLRPQDNCPNSAQIVRHPKCSLRQQKVGYIITCNTIFHCNSGQPTPWDSSILPLLWLLIEFNVLLAKIGKYPSLHCYPFLMVVILMSCLRFCVCYSEKNLGKMYV